MVTHGNHLVGDLRAQLGHLSMARQLSSLADRFPNQVVFSTSFGMEDQVITHHIFQEKLPIRVFTLDTGRLFPQTYSTWAATLEKYHQPIVPFVPDATQLQELLTRQGPNGFYDSVENRKACCYVRKVAPLALALQGQAIWITGIRAEQSPNRHDMDYLEWDGQHQLVKFHPLFDWTFEQVKSTVHAHQIPYNPLHDKGFVSIGCAPCTRAIQPGEDFRAGRWWWEDQSKKECGLHQHSEPSNTVTTTT
jgi:phosphoadenosine phosphosulfate reductase